MAGKMVRFGNREVDIDDPETWRVSDEEKHRDPATTKWRCLVYSRVSTGRQVKSSSGLSIGTRRDHDDETKQKDLLNAFFDDPRNKNFTYIGKKNADGSRRYYFDVASGYLMKNRSEWDDLFNEVRRLVEDENIDDDSKLCVIACYSDRLGRNVRNYVQTMMYFHDHGVQVFVVGGGIVRGLIHFGSSAQDELQYLNQLAYEAFPNEAQIEGQVRHARDDTEGWILEKRAYFGCPTKYGYKLNPAKYRGRDARGNLDWDRNIAWNDFIPDEEEAFVVRKIFELAGRDSDPMSCIRIADLLNESAIAKTTDKDGKAVLSLIPGKGIGHRSRNKPGAPFTAAFVQDVIHFESYATGWFYFRKLESTYRLKQVQGFIAKSGVEERDYTAEEKQKILLRAKQDVEGNLRHDILVMDGDKPAIVYPPLISHEQWEKARGRVLSRVGKKYDMPPDAKGHGFLAGLLYCGVCGSPYYRATRRNPQKPLRKAKESHDIGGYKDSNLQNRGKAGWKPCSNQLYIPYAIDDVVFSALVKSCRGEAMIQAMAEIDRAKAENASNEAAAEAELKAIAKELPVLYKEFSKNDFEAKSLNPKEDADMIAFYKTEAAKAKGRIAELKAKADLLAEKKKQGPNVDALEETMKAVMKASGDPKSIVDKAGFVRSVVDRIYYIRSSSAMTKTKRGKVRKKGDAVIVVYLKGTSALPVSDRKPDQVWKVVRYPSGEKKAIILAHVEDYVPKCFKTHGPDVMPDRIYQPAVEVKCSLSRIASIECLADLTWRN